MKKYMKIDSILIITGSIILIPTVPITIAYLIGLKTDGGDWLQFFGTYFGVILSSLITIYAIKRQEQNNQENAVKNYFLKLRIEEINKIYSTIRELTDIVFQLQVFVTHIYPDLENSSINDVEKNITKYLRLKEINYHTDTIRMSVQFEKSIEYKYSKRLGNLFNSLDDQAANLYKYFVDINNDKIKRHALATNTGDNLEKAMNDLEKMNEVAQAMFNEISKIDNNF